MFATLLTLLTSFAITPVAVNLLSYGTFFLSTGPRSTTSGCCNP